MSYAQSFASGDDKLLDVEVDPSDVVAVPTDYNGTKMRVCKFKVVAESQGLIEKPLVTSSYELPEVEFEDNTGYCSECFAEVDDSDNFCPNCGEEL